MSDLKERVAHAMWHQGVDAAIAIVLEEAARCAEKMLQSYTTMDDTPDAIRALAMK